jgi:hypothetical protein
MPPYQVRGRLIKSGMTELPYLVAGLIVIAARLNTQEGIELLFSSHRRSRTMSRED